MEIRRIKIFVCIIVLFLIPSFSHIYGATLSKPANNLGLVAYLSLNDATSTSATDFSGNRNTGTLINMDHPGTASSGWGSGKFGTGLIFDGLGDYVTMNGVANDVVETSFTFSIWIKSGWTGAFDTVLAINTAALGNQTQIFIDNTLTVRIYDGTQDATELSSSGSVVDGKWHHVVYSRTGATGTLYVDGVSQGTHNSSDTFTGTDLWSLGQEFDGGPVASDFYLGSMDEIRVYNRPLAQADVTALYNTGLLKTNSSQNNLITNGLVEMLSFDGADLVSNTAYDRSGLVNNGTVVGTTKTLGKIGQALNFDGNDYVTFDGVANDVTQTSFSVAFWTKCATAGQLTYWSVSDSTGTVDKTSIYSQAGNVFRLYDGSDNTGEIASAITACDNNWHHVVYSRTGSVGTLYVDGISQGTHTAGDTFASNDLWTIGMEWAPGPTPSLFFNGAVDDFRVYNRPLSLSEIKTLYNAGGSKINSSQNVTKGTLDSGLVGLWSFNGPDLTDRVYDRSGNANDGYLVNMSTSTAKTIGKVGQAINFDGVDDSVIVTSTSALELDMNESATFSFWVNRESVSGSSAGPIYKRTSGSGGYNVDILTAGAVAFAIGDNFGNNNRISYETSTTMNLNQWYHVVVTYDGSITSGGIRIYFDGVLQSMINAADNYGGGSSSNAIDFSLGARESGTSRLLDGKMDEVRMYNRVLSASEIKQLYLIGR